MTILRAFWRRLAPERVRRPLALIRRAARLALRESAFLTFWLQRPGPDALRVIGLFGDSHGIARGAHLTCRALDALGVPYVKVDASEIFKGRVNLNFLDAHPVGWIIQMNPPELRAFLDVVPRRRLKGPLYGYWAWELPKGPKSWRRQAGVVSEIWTPSEFVAEAFHDFGRKTRSLGHPLHLADYSQLRPAARISAFQAITLFDFNSSMARKNPLGVLEAFQRAFGSDPSVQLIIKTQNGALYPELLAQLRHVALDNVSIIDEVWSHAEVMAQIKASDVLISLHRAEGFGLTLAEAMALGTPVLATGWSGNMDFMSSESALLTPYKLVSVEDPQAIYLGQVWADPDLEISARHLRRLRDDPQLRTRLSHAAHVEAELKLSAAAWAERLPPNLVELTRQSTRAESARPVLHDV